MVQFSGFYTYGELLPKTFYRFQNQTFVEL